MKSNTGLKQKKSLFTFLLFTSVLFSYAQELIIEPIDSQFYVYTTFKEYDGNRISAHGLYVVTNDGILMIDSPWDQTQNQPIVDSIQKKHDLPVKWLIATHFHEDRAGGFSYFQHLGVETYATGLTNELLEKEGQTTSKNILSLPSEYNFGGVLFEVYYPGKGHSSDNIVVWFPEKKLLYGGCFVKSTEAADLGYLGDADTNEWLQSIQKVMKKYRNPEFVITGHQDWKNTESLKYTLKLLKKHKNHKK